MARVLLMATYSRALSDFIAPFARYLESRGHDVVMAASDEELAGPSTLPALRAQGFNVVSIPYTNRARPHRDLLAAWQVWRLLRESRFDIVHTFTAKAGFIGRLIGRYARVPVVVHTAFSFPHLDEPAKAWLYRPFELKATAVCDHIFCISQLGYEQATALGRAPKHGISNAGIGLDYERFAHLEDREACRRALGLPPGVPLVGTAARLTPHKRIDHFLQVCRAVSQTHRGVQFLILGDGPERAALDALVVEFGLSDRARFLPYLLDPADVVKYMRALDVFILPTEREGFGMVFVEAMATETAVIGPDIAPINGIVSNGATGILVPAGCLDAYVTAVRQLLDDDALRAALGAKGRNRVLAEFDNRVVFEKIEDTYRTLQAQAVKPDSHC